MKAINRCKPFAVLALAVLGAAAVAVSAHADQTAQGAGSRAVRYSDLNLRTDAGAKVLYRRIHDAAMRVCGDAHSRQLDQAAASEPCMDKAISSSVRAVDSLPLTRIAHAHGYAVDANIRVASVR